MKDLPKKVGTTVAKSAKEGKKINGKEEQGEDDEGFDVPVRRCVLGILI